jgi:hypothetical protein
MPWRSGAYFAGRWQKREQPAPQTGRISVDPPEVKQAYLEAQKKSEEDENKKGPAEKSGG